MSKKELSRVEVMGRVKARNLRRCEAGELLRLSYRQSKRIWARYEDFGPTLAGEHLASDDGRNVPAETLRGWLKQAGW